MPARSIRPGRGPCGNVPICSPLATDDYSFFRIKQQRGTYYTRSTSSVLSRMNTFRLAHRQSWHTAALFMPHKPSMISRGGLLCGDGYKNSAANLSVSKPGGQASCRYLSSYLFPPKTDCVWNLLPNWQPCAKNTGTMETLC